MKRVLFMLASFGLLVVQAIAQSPSVPLLPGVESEPSLNMPPGFVINQTQPDLESFRLQLNGPATNYIYVQPGYQTERAFDFGGYVENPSTSIPTLEQAIDYNEILQGQNSNVYKPPLSYDLDVESILRKNTPDVYTGIVDAENFSTEQLEELLARQNSVESYYELKSEISPLLKANTDWAAVIQTEALESVREFIFDPNSIEWRDNVQNIARAHDAGNPLATAIYGEALLAGRGTEQDQTRGLTLLENAAEQGVLRALTDLGEFGLDNPSLMSRADSLKMLQQALSKGDGNAAFALADVAYESGDFYRGVDLDATVIGYGTGLRPHLARHRLLATCARQNVACIPMTVAVASSRATSDDLSDPWKDSHSDDYVANFSFVTTMVPFLSNDLLLDAVPEEGFFGKFFGTRRPDQFRESTFFLDKFIDEETFLDGLKRQQSLIDDQRFLLYIHGFNNSVEDALITMARMKQRGGLPGIPVIYSWAAGKDLLRVNWGNLSRPLYSGYSRDVQMASNSCLAFREFLLRFAKEVGADNVVLVAHSHGAKLLHSALTDCEFQEATPVPFPGQFDSVIYAAPDIDLEQFQQSFAQVEAKAERIAIYMSANDFAIDASTNFIRGGLPRLGGGSQTVFGSMIQGIDATKITGNEESGHSYVFLHPKALNDMRLFLAGESPPRDCLASMGTGKGWELTTTCSGTR
ncbi:alpha/beta hydrolase [Devosia sp.]|uniref:alpha/beta hydrolase n=1 Tax=Devosia sp. TaxID=1871048 RepID=UPI003A946567